jgi:hypothetical protein
VCVGASIHLINYVDAAAASQNVSCHNISAVTVIIVDVGRLNFNTIIGNIHTQGGGTGQGSGQLLAVGELSSAQSTRGDHMI